MQQIQRRVMISGRVQGVFFRQTTRQRARELDVQGWVRNRLDGRVEALFYGPPQAVEAIVRWCREGPPGADVAAVEVVEESTSDLRAGFHIRRTE